MAQNSMPPRDPSAEEYDATSSDLLQYLEPRLFSLRIRCAHLHLDALCRTKKTPLVTCPEDEAAETAALSKKLSHLQLEYIRLRLWNLRARLDPLSSPPPQPPPKIPILLSFAALGLCSLFGFVMGIALHSMGYHPLPYFTNQKRQISQPKQVQSSAPRQSIYSHNDKGHIVVENSDMLRASVDAYVAANGNAEATVSKVLGWPISVWDVSNVTDFTLAFSPDRNEALTAFNEDLSGWNMSRATSLSRMFYKNLQFNQNLSMWDTGNVRDLRHTFSRASAFNGDVSGWKVGRVVNMDNLFEGALDFNQPLHSWDTSAVTSLGWAFSRADKFNQPIDMWNVEKVVKFASVFGGLPHFNQSLDNWNVSRGENFNYMFSLTRRFDQNLESWDMSSAISLRRMFHRTKSFNQPLNAWDVSRVTHMESMFAASDMFNQDLSAWNTERVRDMIGMFKDSEAFNQNIAMWDIRKLETAALMFTNAKKFNQSMCPWRTEFTGKLLLAQTGDPVQEMFEGTACPHPISPTLTSAWCHSCESSAVSSTNTDEL